MKKRGTKIRADKLMIVEAPTNWEAMFGKDPEGPEVQAFLNRVLATEMRRKQTRKSAPAKPKRIEKKRYPPHT